ncbi:MAG: PTS sugar transporter subunit IIC, partial [Allobaculum sp.]|nr:PTS sugar transporter subunit IIC [Allobaculum sp.]
MSQIGAFLAKKDIQISAKRYGIDALSAMAQGLFASLLMGTILNTLGTLFALPILVEIGSYATAVKGPAMAAAIGMSLNGPNLVLFSLLAVGYAADALGGAGGPLAVYFIALIACECGKLVFKETKVDILVTPFVTIFTGSVLAIVLAPTIGHGAIWLGNLIMWATDLQPFLMGILVSVLMGIFLTLPISSAAICAALSLTGLAGGAALAGCCTQMIGFAVMSFAVNKWAGLVAQGIGTSMLQMGNIIKKPIIWLPTILASAIIGPITTVLFHLEMNGPAISSGMGTCGLVGQIGVITGWLNEMGSLALIPLMDWIALLLVSFVLPALFT